MNGYNLLAHPLQMTKTQEPRSKKKAWLVGCSVAAGVVLLAGGGLFGFFYNKFVDFGKASDTVEADAAVYRKSGMAWEAKDLKNPLVTDANNAAALFLQADKLLGKDTLGDAFSKAQDLFIDKKYSDALAALKPYEPALKLIERATRQPFLDYGEDPDIAFLTHFPELSYHKAYAKALCLRAQIEAGMNVPTAALRDLRTSWKIAVLTEQLPSYMSMLVDVSVQRIVLDTIQQCASIWIDDASRLKALESVIHPNDLPSLPYAMRGEAYQGLTELRNMNHYSPEKVIENEVSDSPISRPSKPIDTSHLVRTGIPKDVKLRGFAARHFQAWAELKAALDKYPNEPEKLRQELIRLSDKWSSKETMSNMLVAISFSVMPEEAKVIVELQAETTATRYLLEAMQLRAKSGKWPTKVDDIPGTWIDPFNGKPLLIKSATDSFLAYSVGPNMMDDGGRRRSPGTDKSKESAYDIVASYPPRPLNKAHVLATKP